MTKFIQVLQKLKLLLKNKSYDWSSASEIETF